LAERADELLDAVLASPEAMAPRLVLADWWMERGDPRGELVIVQHVLEDPSLAPERRDELEARERALLDQHEEQWLAELGLRAGEGTFIRGFVERIWLRPGRLDAAPVRCPARELHVSPEVELGWLLVHPLLARVRTLDLSEREPENAWGALACCERLRGLTSLSLRHCWLEDGALRTLTGSAHLGGLRRLNLQDNLLEDRDVPLLAGCEALAGLQELDLSYNPLGGGGVPTLAASPHLRGLRRLGLRATQLEGPDAAALAARGPESLRMLDLSLGELGDEAAFALAASERLRGLVSLDLGYNEVSEEGAWTLLRSLPHLRRLELRGNPLPQPFPPARHATS
jgi:uncharacterized protein (TIGR02996 family)